MKSLALAMWYGLRPFLAAIGVATLCSLPLLGWHYDLGYTMTFLLIYLPAWGAVVLRYPWLLP